MNRFARIFTTRPPLERTAWALAALCAVLAVVAAGRPAFTNASRPVRGLINPVIALQTSQSLGEVDFILSDAPSPDREVMRIKQYEDFGYIAVYLSLFSVIAVSLASSRPKAYLIAALAVAAAGFDILENLAVLRIVDASVQSTTQAMLDRLRVWSMAKTALQAASIAATGAFCCLSKSRQLRVAGAFAVAVAAFITIALVKHPLLAWASPALTASLCIHAATLKFLTYEPASRNPVQNSF